MGNGNRTRNAVFRKLGHSGREVNLPDSIPESELDPSNNSAAMQPGGSVFIKPTTMYPVGEAKVSESSVKGVPVSGRSWKLECKRKSSMAVAGKLIRKSWDDKMSAKAVHQAVKAKEKSLVDARIEEKKRKKQEREDRKKRKEQNQLKSAVYQTVSTSTVRKMSRKQLRAVRKMDPHAGVINPAPITKSKGLNGRVRV